MRPPAWRDVFTAPAILLIGNDPTNQHPLLAWQIRNNVRLHRARLYVINSQDDQAAPSGDKFHADSRRGGRQSWRLSSAATTPPPRRSDPARQGCMDRSARQTARRAEPGHHFRFGDSRQGHRRPGRLRFFNSWREIRLPRRLRELPRRRRYGSLSRPAPGLSPNRRQ